MFKKQKVSMDRPYLEDECVVVAEKFEIPSSFFERVLTSYKNLSYALMKDIDYTAADICGDELWQSLSEYERRHAFLCLKHIAVDSYRDMELVPGGSGYSLYFRLI